MSIQEADYTKDTVKAGTDYVKEYVIEQEGNQQQVTMREIYLFGLQQPRRNCHCLTIITCSSSLRRCSLRRRRWSTGRRCTSPRSTPPSSIRTKLGWDHKTVSNLSQIDSTVVPNWSQSCLKLYKTLQQDNVTYLLGWTVLHGDNSHGCDGNTWWSRRRDGVL